jgi:hypothetical protein
LCRHPRFWTTLAETTREGQLGGWKLLWRERNYGDGFEHAYPAGWAFVVRGDEAEGTLVGGERGAVESVGDEDFRIENAGIEFTERENDAVAVLRFGEDVSC